GMAEPKEIVSVEFEVRQAPPLSLYGEVMRVTPHGAYAEYGVRFAGVEPRKRDELARHIDALATGAGVGKRSAPRVYRRVAAKCRNVDPFHATMNDLSRGGMG